MAVSVGPDGKVTYIADNPLEAALRGALEGASESAPISGLRKMFGWAGHVAGAPARAVNAVGNNLAGTGAPIDVSDAALYGRDLNTGVAPVGYGTLLRKSVLGEDDASGVGQLLEDAGSVVSDPLTAALSARGIAGGGAAAEAPWVRTVPEAEVRRAGNIRPSERMVQDVADFGVQFNRKPVGSSAPSGVLDTDLVNPGKSTKLGIKNEGMMDTFGVNYSRNKRAASPAKPDSYTHGASKQSPRQDRDQLNALIRQLIQYGRTGNKAYGKTAKNSFGSEKPSSNMGRPGGKFRRD